MATASAKKFARHVGIMMTITVGATAWLALAQVPDLMNPPAGASTGEPATQPSTQPTTRESAYERLLGGATAAEQPLLPTPRAGADVTTGDNALQPGAPTLPLRREGSYVVDKTGRLTHAADGQGWEFVFNSDGAALQDPPMKVLPNLKLMGMETQLETLGVDLQFNVTGMVTEYRGRNYILFEKVVVVHDSK